MPQLRWKLFELFDIPVCIDVTFAILLFIFASSGESFVVGLMQAIILAFSIIAHEYGHALTGRAFGCETSTITLSFIGGCASMTSMPRKGWQEFLVAAAGPLVSFVLAGIGWLLVEFLPFRSFYELYPFACLMWLNFVLGVFNLMPGFPMDGGRIFRSVLMHFVSRPKATLVAMWVGRAFAVVLALSGFYAMYKGGNWAFVRIFIAWMIWNEGYREYQLALMESSWDHYDFRAKVSPPPYEKDDE